MGKPAKLKSKDLRSIGYQGGSTIGRLLEASRIYFKSESRDEILRMLKELKEKPETFVRHPAFSSFAAEMMQSQGTEYHLNQTDPAKFEIFGANLIDQSALHQMYTAIKLPVSVGGALMPDAHAGYGLPIGGVLATENSVIPYGVGVDIGCRMSLSIFGIREKLLAEKVDDFQDMLIQNTRFGLGVFDRPGNHALLDDSRFGELKLLKKLKNVAAQQLGSSGSGNHFVEFGVIEIIDNSSFPQIEPGRYLGLLSHSGSRRFGADIARHYTKIAMDTCTLPKEARHLAWLDLDSEAGAEYWLAMNLAGDYASACHDKIHKRMSQSLGERPLLTIENHHNFAWKEIQPDGRELIIHRKGATPAGKGELGIIPGSMTSPGYIVRGKGNPDSYQSASHGAGRLYSRKEAKDNFTKSMFMQHMEERGVKLIGGGLDESPFVYKDIREVMQTQTELVDELGIFEPKVVRMA